MTKRQFLNIEINNFTLPELLAKTDDLEKPILIVTPNVDHLIKLKKDAEFLKIYRIADYVICDSKIIQFTMSLLGTPIKEKISGSDLFPAFYNYHQDNHNLKIFLLGGMEGVAKQAQIKVNEKVGRDIVVGALSPSFGFESNEKECSEIIDEINGSGANVLAIGVGAPKQEKWIFKHRHLLPKIKIYLPIGATIDFEAGQTSRSPKWMSNVGLEWLYRLLAEPRTLWKRYLVDSLPFFSDVWKYRSQQYQCDPLVELKSQPLGLLLYNAGLISAQDLETIIETQKAENYTIRFGQIAQNMGLVSGATTAFFAEQLPNILEKRMVLSLIEYLQIAHLLTPSQIDELPIDKIDSEIAKSIVEHKYLSQKTVQWFMNLISLIRA